jgi:hypothetical protein
MAPPLSESSADVVYGVAVEDDAHGYGGFGVVARACHQSGLGPQRLGRRAFAGASAP